MLRANSPQLADQLAGDGPRKQVGCQYPLIGIRAMLALSNRWTTYFGLMGTALLLAGCTNQPYPNPYGAPGYSNPWANPAGPPATLPPPQGVPGALPSVPALPPSTDPLAPPSAAAPSANWSNPGTMSQQQQRATVFDPYADNTAGPEIVGGRPREFQKPLAEPVRARGFRDTRWPF